MIIRSSGIRCGRRFRIRSSIASITSSTSSIASTCMFFNPFQYVRIDSITSQPMSD